MMHTPHINPTAKIARTILLPGDPLRARFIAESFLENSEQFNGVRGMLGFTGKYKGKEVSVMGTGMGIPSMGIYAYELINYYKVNNLIRIGSCGAFMKEIKIYDIIIALGASSNSNFANQFELPGTFSATASWKLLQKCVQAAKTLDMPVNVGNILTSDFFYSDDLSQSEKWAKMGILATEMECYSLYTMAARYRANALGILTVSDHLDNFAETSAQERERTFTQMIELALEMSV